jgi:hypothetical protein
MTAVIIIAFIILLWLMLKHETFVNDAPNMLSPYLGYWLYTSEDGLRKEILSIDYGGDNRFLKITRKYNVRKWFPPLNPGERPYIAPVETWTVSAPMYKVVVISPNYLYLRSIEPTYAESPFRVKLTDDGTYLEILGKKYISSNKLDPSKS